MTTSEEKTKSRETIINTPLKREVRNGKVA
jgi:hypothetical protein